MMIRPVHTPIQSSVEAPGQTHTDEEPPMSRLFVNGPASLTKEVLQQAFASYGNVQYVHLLSKPGVGFAGRCFIKYDRASSAALAMENLHGATVSGDATNQPLTVVLAVPRGQTKESMIDNEVPPRSRLFVTYYRAISDDEFKAKFAPFPDLEDIRILHATTGEPRGIGYVKFSKSSSAMRAMEDVNEMEASHPSAGQPYRVKISGPTPPRGTTQTAGSSGLKRSAQPAQSFGAPQPYGAFAGAQTSELKMWKNPALGRTRVDNNTPAGSRVWLTVSKRTPIDTLANLFMPFGFLESVHLMKGKNCGFAKYNSSIAAVGACNSLNGAEIAPGVILKIAIATPQVGGIVGPAVKRLRV